MVSSIRLLLRQHSSQAFARGIRFQRKGWPKSGKARMGAWRHAALRQSKASQASRGKSRCSDFLSLFSPLVKSYKRGRDIGKPLDETPIVTNESNKRLDLSVSIWRWTSGDGLQILLGGEYPSFTHMMGLHLDGFSLRPCSRNRSKTTHILSRCSSSVLEKIITSSR